MTDPFARLGAAMVRWRWVVLLVWVVALGLAGALAAPKVSKEVRSGGIFAPDSESDRAAQTLAREFNASTQTNLVIVFRSPRLTVDDAEFKDQVTAGVGRVKSASSLVKSASSFYDTGDPNLVSPDKRTTFVVAAMDGEENEIQEAVPELRHALDGLTVEHYVTGVPAVDHDGQLAAEEDLKRSERFTIPVVLILLLLVFRTVVAAAIPLILGAASVVLALAAIYGVALTTPTSTFAVNTASMIGLGLGIDFALIVITRFREERMAGRDTRDAVAATMATAGRSITYSGITVLLAMLALTLLMFRLTVIRSISMAVMIVALTALLAGLTLQPALLGILGGRLEWLRILPRPKPPQPGHEGFWYRFSHLIMRRPWLWLAASLVLLGVLAVPIKDIKFYGVSTGVLPSTIESVQGVNAMQEGFGESRLYPVQVVVSTDKGGVWKPEFLDAVQRLTEQVAADPRNEQAYSIFTLARDIGLSPEQYRQLTPDQVRAVPGAAQFVPQFVNLNGDNNVAVVSILSRHGQYQSEHQAFVKDLRDKIVPGIPQLRVYDVQVGGGGASFLDFRDAIYGRFPVVAAVVMALIFVILMMFFQSVFLPLKAILLNLASIFATYGALVFFFQNDRLTDIFGFSSLGGLFVAVPPILFAILFALSTDYEVFLLSRVKEYYHETGNNEEAVATGLEHTAGVITAAGLILIGTFGSFASATNVTVKELGLGLAFGVLLDSTIVRIVMVPATMRLAGDANWWMPAWLKKIVPELREGPAPALQPGPLSPALATATAVLANGPASMPAPAATAAATPAPAVTMAIDGILRPTGGSVGAPAIPLPHARPFRIGRDSEAELWLYDPRVSRYHARIDYDPTRQTFVVTDLGSTNGVYVNGQRIAEPTPLRNGDQLEISTVGNITFAFEARPRPAAGLPRMVAQPAGGSA